MVKRINTIGDEQILEMLEQTLIFYTNSDDKDITDGLSDEQFRDLAEAMSEPAEKDTVSHVEFKKIIEGWRTV